MKKFYVVAIMLMVLLAFVACTNKEVQEQTTDQAKEQVTEETQEQTIEEVITGYENDVTTWFEKEVITEEDIAVINEKIETMKNKLSDEDILDDARATIESLVQKLEDLKAKIKEA